MEITLSTPCSLYRATISLFLSQHSRSSPYNALNLSRSRQWSQVRDALSRHVCPDPLCRSSQVCTFKSLISLWREIGFNALFTAFEFECDFLITFVTLFLTLSSITSLKMVWFWVLESNLFILQCSLPFLPFFCNGWLLLVDVNKIVFYSWAAVSYTKQSFFFLSVHKA